MKIQLKRSSVLSNGVAKEPDPAQMEYGELAVNYAADDPALFLKDSKNKIIKVTMNTDAISAALTAVKAAAADSTTDLNGLKTALLAALANF